MTVELDNDMLNNCQEDDIFLDNELLMDLFHDLEEDMKKDESTPAPSSAIDNQLVTSSTTPVTSSAIDNQLVTSSTTPVPSSAIDNQLVTSSTTPAPSSAIDNKFDNIKRSLFGFLPSSYDISNMENTVPHGMSFTQQLNEAIIGEDTSIDTSDKDILTSRKNVSLILSKFMFVKKPSYKLVNDSLEKEKLALENQGNFEALKRCLSKISYEVCEIDRVNLMNLVKRDCTLLIYGKIDFTADLDSIRIKTKNKSKYMLVLVKKKKIFSSRLRTMNTSNSVWAPKYLNLIFRKIKKAYSVDVLI